MKPKPTIMLVGLGGLGSVVLMAHHGGLLLVLRHRHNPGGGRRRAGGVMSTDLESSCTTNCTN